MTSKVSGSAASSQAIVATSQSDALIVNEEIKYERPFQNLARTRAYTRGPKIGAQRMSRVVRMTWILKTQSSSFCTSCF